MKNNALLICFGTRPEWLKIKPLIDLLDKGEYKLFFTGQHTDLLNDIDVDYKATISENISENRLDSIVIGCINLPNDDFSGVLVQGDTASAFACALGAYHRGLKIYYMESGLRSYDLNNPYPEEGYRQMISRIADVNFVPTELSRMNLISEKVNGTIHVVGNSVLDNLTKYKSNGYNNTILVTMHRRENHHWLEKWFNEINDLAKEFPQYEFIIPLHPNPNVQKYKHLLTNMKIVEPLTHNEMINIIKDCKLIISDSGGIQEEGTYFNKKVIVCRKTTERPEGIDTGHLYLCYSPEDLKSLFYILENDYKINNICPYGDGQTSIKIKQIIYGN